MQLAGRRVLIIEDEPLIALELETILQDAGAETRLAQTIEQAIATAQQSDLSAAVVDHLLSDGKSTNLCALLELQGIPFVTYSGCSEVPCAGHPHLSKPVPGNVMVDAVASVIAHAGDGSSGRSYNV